MSNRESFDGNTSRDTGNNKPKPRVDRHTWETQTHGTAVGEGLVVDAKQWFADLLMGKRVRIDAVGKKDAAGKTSVDISFPSGLKHERDDLRSSEKTLVYYVSGKDPETGKNVIRAITLDAAGIVTKLQDPNTGSGEYKAKLYGKVYSGMDQGALNTVKTFFSELNSGKKFYAKAEVTIATAGAQPSITVRFPGLNGIQKIERDDDPRRTNRNRIVYNITGVDRRGNEAYRAVSMDISHITKGSLAAGTYHTLLIGQTYDGD